MRIFITFTFILILLFGCNNNPNQSKNLSKNLLSEYSPRFVEKIWDGEYCADIEYYNPNTGTSSDYTLIIEVSNNELEQINWPNGGSLDDFYNIKFNIDGYTEFTNDKGYDYTVQIIGDSEDCFEDVPKAVRCKGITKGGSQCNNLTDNKSGYCWQHE